VEKEKKRHVVKNIIRIVMVIAALVFIFAEYLEDRPM